MSPSLAWGSSVIRTVVISLLCWSAFFGLAFAEERADQGLASAQIDAFHATLIQGMAMDDHATRYELYRASIVDLFDVVRIAQISCGRGWRKLDEAQQQAFVDALTDNIAHTYASRFTTFNDQQFSVEEEQAVRKGVVVKAVVTAPERTVQLDYFLSDGKVFNVAADGVSDLSLRRSEYSRLLKEDGFDALLAQIKDNTRNLAGESADE